jgi:hypothetical protein
MYIVRGRNAATAATADHAIAQLWNPHSTQRIKVIQIAVFKTTAGTAGDAFRLRRSTARGTAGSTVTPNIESHSERAIAPPSGMLLDLAAFSVQPTLASGEVGPGWVAAAFAASGIMYPVPGGIVIPPGTGLVIAQVAATIWPVSEIMFSVLEDW